MAHPATRLFLRRLSQIPDGDLAGIAAALDAEPKRRATLRAAAKEKAAKKKAAEDAAKEAARKRTQPVRSEQ